MQFTPPSPQVLLRVQPSSNWQLPEASHTLATLLSFTAHPKPKLRKAAQHSVVSVVRGSAPDLDPHPAATQAAQHCQVNILLSKYGPMYYSYPHITIFKSVFLTSTLVPRRP